MCVDVECGCSVCVTQPTRYCFHWDARGQHLCSGKVPKIMKANASDTQLVAQSFKCQSYAVGAPRHGTVERARKDEIIAQEFFATALRPLLTTISLSIKHPHCQRVDHDLSRRVRLRSLFNQFIGSTINN